MISPELVRAELPALQSNIFAKRSNFIQYRFRRESHIGPEDMEYIMSVIPKLSLIACSLFSQPVLASFEPSEGSSDFGTGTKIVLSSGFDEIDNTSPSYDIPQKLSGVHFRASLGHDFEVSPSLLIGVEGGIGGVRGSAESVKLARDTLEMAGGRDLDVLARIGYRAAGRTLAYAKFGYANSALKAWYRGPGGNSEHHEYASGFRFGAGIEQGLSGPTFVRVEYLRTHYGEERRYYQTPKRNQILIGLGARFGRVR